MLNDHLSQWPSITSIAVNNGDVVIMNHLEQLLTICLAQRSMPVNHPATINNWYHQIWMVWLLNLTLGNPVVGKGLYDKHMFWYAFWPAKRYLSISGSNYLSTGYPGKYYHRCGKHPLLNYFPQKKWWFPTSMCIYVTFGWVHPHTRCLSHMCVCGHTTSVQLNFGEPLSYGHARTSQVQQAELCPKKELESQKGSTKKSGSCFTKVLTGVDGDSISWCFSSIKTGD